MNHQSNVNELLNEVEELLLGIESIYAEARTSESVVVVARPKVKSCMEHLRSALDYIAHDLSLTLREKPKKVYFPYGKNIGLYQESLNRNLPNLDLKYHSSLESLQPHSCGDHWLIHLCKVSNFNKHVQLQSQERRNSTESAINFGNIAHGIIPGSKLVFENCTYNGRPIARSGKLEITGAESLVDITQQLDAPIPVNREYKWVQFLLKDTDVDVLDLLKKSHKCIREFSTTIYSL